MILEFSALSRLTGKPIFEEKAKKAMDFLWHQRNRGSDLMGTVLNIESGDWIRRGMNQMSGAWRYPGIKVILRCSKNSVQGVKKV